MLFIELVDNGTRHRVNKTVHACNFKGVVLYARRAWLPLRIICMMREDLPMQLLTNICRPD